MCTLCIYCVWSFSHFLLTEHTMVTGHTWHLRVHSVSDPEPYDTSSLPKDISSAQNKFHPC